MQIWVFLYKLLVAILQSIENGRNEKMNWEMISAISTAAMTLIILFTAFYAAFQLREIKKSRKLTAFVSLSEFLQEESTRKARGVLLKSSKKGFNNLSEEDKKAAEKACSTYELAGIMTTKKLIDKDLILKWRDSIIKCWEAAKPMVIEYRKSRGRDYCDSFEKLYEMAKRIKIPTDNG